MTIAQLLTHRAGFRAADGEDASTGSVLATYLASHSPREPPKPAYLAMFLSRSSFAIPARDFAYLNAGYLDARRCHRGGRPAVLTRTIVGLRSGTGWCYGAAPSQYGALCRLTADGLCPEPTIWRSSSNSIRLLQSSARRRGTGCWTRPGRPTGSPATRPGTAPAYAYAMSVAASKCGTLDRGAANWPPMRRDRALVETSTFAMRIADGTSWFVHSTPLVLGGAWTKSSIKSCFGPINL